MSLRKLYEHFRKTETLPIEIPEIREAIIGLGIQDEIIYQDRQLPASELHGVFYQWREQPRPYADSVFKTLILYPKSAPPETQRLICAKESIHIMDSAIEKVNTHDKLRSLVEKLLGPLATEDFGLADYIASQDRMAIYRCVPLLFPIAAREQALKRLNAEKEMSAKDVAEWAALPPRLVNMVLGDDWPRIESQMMEDC